MKFMLKLAQCGELLLKEQILFIKYFFRKRNKKLELSAFYSKLNTPQKK